MWGSYAGGQPRRHRRHFTVRARIELATALDAAPEAAAFFAGLSYTNKRLYVLWVEEAKKQETRSARVAKAIEMHSEHRTR